MRFLLVSNNRHKLEELQRILLPLGIEVMTAASLGISLDGIEETGDTFEENAMIKAMAGYEKTGLPSIADDSGLAVDVLGGRPGVYSARYGGEGATESQKNEKLLKELENVPDEQRTAKFVCCICCVVNGREAVTARGECKGKIGYRQVGTNGFGYDPIFMIDENRSFAQLTDEEKDSISHRGNALKIFRDRISEYTKTKKE